MDDYHRLNLKSIAILVIAGLAMLFSCETDISEVNELRNEEEVPNVYARNIAMYYSDSAIVRLKIEAPELKEFAEKEDREPFIEFPKGLNVTFYNQFKQVESTMKADFAIYKSKDKVFEARSNVEVRNYSEKQELYSDFLIWDEEKKEISSNQFVKIVTESGVTYGDEGFIADENFTYFQILKSKGTLEVEEDF